MTDAELATFIPLYGDRMAVSGFCRDKKGASKKDNKRSHHWRTNYGQQWMLLKEMHPRVEMRMMKLMMLIVRLKNSRRKKLKGNKNAEKTTRMIELSCCHLGEVTVEFFESSGFTRSPIAHTCGRVSKVPSTYENCPSIRCEFNNLLSSKIWVMDIVWGWGQAQKTFKPDTLWL